MARNSLDKPVMTRTTIVASKTLLDRMSIHVKKQGEDQGEFITRAIINQMENDGDLEIRDIMMEELNND